MKLLFLFYFEISFYENNFNNQQNELEQLPLNTYFSYVYYG